ncbi:MAG: hypothetical protein OMM_07454 [Candidatus Magnetoglobus multicellularis str. Araruama]|uniref:histidine kinase n=1 Tax=Candidatus Magnetoglobus multicellularis str. Araruama TaxID=890399 RepID=A0A1V1PCJ8_9BACT|nr:MAG: hypothetical protein OMM_07454 [Candidatus Magnetoglobus multicellularis str. Araruama]
MTAGVAHELNNPMTGILQYVQYCIKYTDKESKTYPVLNDIYQETKRCVDIVDNLLTYSRHEHTQQEQPPTNIHSIIDRVLRLLQYRIDKENIQLTTDKTDSLPEICLHTSSMQQVFMNLIGNAIDAVQKVDPKHIHIQTSCIDRHISIDIKDNGCGIDKSIQQLIFDPFFTSKPAGKGTGLGLSISKRIVENHHGKLLCHSTSEGAIFKVILPV